MVEADEVADAAAGRLDTLAEALTELAGLLLDDEGVHPTLQRVADLAVRTIPGCAGAGVTLVGPDGFTTAAFTHPDVLAVDREQYRVGDGPCLTAVAERAVVRVDLGEAANRWPDFARAARGCGVSSFLAAPLLARGEAVGSLNLYSKSPDGFDALDETLVALFVGQASVALANARMYASTRRLTSQLEEALASRAGIEQAKGVLMARHGVGPEEAFALLRRRSQATNTKLREVARTVVAEATAARELSG